MSSLSTAGVAAIGVIKGGRSEDEYCLEIMRCCFCFVMYVRTYVCYGRSQPQAATAARRPPASSGGGSIW